MNAENTIRHARDDDASAISDIILSALRETNAKDYTPEIIARVEKNFSVAAVQTLLSERNVFVAAHGQQILGTASLDGEIVRSVFVAPTAQRRGIGRRLMEKVAGVAREAGITALTVPSSVTAEPFYAKLGYSVVGDSYYGDERTIIMNRHLGPL